MIRALGLAAVLVTSSGAAMAEDLENLLEGKAPSQSAEPLIHANTLLSDAARSFSQATSFEANTLMRNLERGEWSEALINWNAAFGGKPFETTPNGIALRALIQLKAGLPVTGLESLFTIEDAKQIHFVLLNMWREAAPETLPAWMVSKIQWKQSFTDFFGPAIEVRVRAADLSGSAHNIEDLLALSAKAPPNSRERAIVDWHLALAYAQADQADKAAKIMGLLLKAKNNPVSPELMNLTAARMLYQNGYFDPAQKYYDKIPKKSEDYLEAQEEKAWTYLRRGQPQNAIATTQSLVNPIFSGQVGPESWFLHSLAQLKVCDYSGVLETMKGFPKEFKDHAVALEQLSQGKAGMKELGDFLERMKKGALTRAEMVRSTRRLPRDLTRDEKMKFLLMSQAILEKEADAAALLYTKSLNNSGLQGHFDTLKGQLLERVHQVKASEISHAQDMAAKELDDTKKIINKMHIVEADLIQRIEATPKLAKNDAKPEVKVGTTGSLARDTLKFPKENEFWFDELTNYRVDVKKGCQARVTR